MGVPLQPARRVDLGGRSGKLMSVDGHAENDVSFSKLSTPV